MNIRVNGCLILCSAWCGIATTSARCRHISTALPSLLLRGTSLRPRLLRSSVCLSHTSVASGDSIDDIVHVDSVGDVHKTWLRDNCRCENCYNAATRQRNVLTHRLAAPALRPASVSSDGGQLVVVWQDGHRSQYDLAWLRSVLPPAPVDRTAKVRSYHTPPRPRTRTHTPHLRYTQ